MKQTYIYILLILCCVRCAQITPLTGGKKDTEAPKLVKATPENASLNFVSKTIELQFDEYITLKDVTNQFIITPQTKNFPDIEAKGKRVIVKFDETLLPNTTYKLSFGNAIVDLRESNNLPNFEYVFSTGSTIDSLRLKGRVLNSTDLQPAAQILIGLYPAASEDSIVYKEKPLYLIRTNDQGQFSFGYLPDKSFRIAGIKDQNKNLVYDGSEEQIASPFKNVNPKDTGDISMMLFKEVPFKSFIKKHSFAENGKAYIIYNKPQPDIKDVKANGLVMYNQTKNRDTLNLYYRNKYDTLETFITYTAAKMDTVYVKIPSQTVRSGRESTIKNQKYILRSTIESSFPYFGTLAFTLNFPVERKNISEKKIQLTAKGDTSRAVVVPYTLVTEKGKDPLMSFTLQTAGLIPETNYTLTFLDSALVDPPSRHNDSIGYKFRTTIADDYAQLSLKLLFPKKENYLVMLQNEKGQTIDERIIELSLTSTAEKIIDYKNVLPGKYFVKVVEDANKNGQFDTGDYFLHKQPEIIFINNTPIKLLAGWEIESEWLIN